MALERYRRVLALPGVRTLLLVGMLARIPLTGTGITLTLHVVNGLGMGFLQAGLVGTGNLIGAAIGSPLAGRFVDRRGLRPVLAVTTAVQFAFWCSAPLLPYEALIPGAIVAGLFAQPVFGALRQCLGAMVPAERHQSAFALDSMAVELSYMVGPALAVALSTGFGTTVTMYAVGVGLVGTGVALYALNPPTQSPGEVSPERVPRRSWLGPGLFTLLGVASSLTFVLTTTELSVVAMLKAGAATQWTGLVIGVWCGYSLIGGFVYGGLPRGFSPLLLTGAMCVFTVPIGLVGGGWWWLCLALVPAGLLCAPAMSATVGAIQGRVPAGARGEAMGLHGTALLIGGACAGPAAGAVVDAHGPVWAFAAAGCLGLVLVLIAFPFWRDARRPAAAEPVSASVSASL
ncbi:MFS transporter [Microtetraspora malaysiensis]|uniref:MFS transporter n=1 Tax=Microtetraspora malaysiensis TaxID=161358 RepID=UPI00082D34E0|nr:MFS transporter [Microtetraspora malaysiensis]